MKAHALVLGIAVLIAGPALSAPADSDGNGTFSIEEMAEAYPDLTEEEFADIDANGDGEIDATELNDAVEKGMIEG